MKKVIKSIRNDPMKAIGIILIATIVITIVVLFTFFTNGNYIAHF